MFMAAARSSIYLQTQIFTEEGTRIICTLVGKVFSPAWLSFGSICFVILVGESGAGTDPLCWDTGGTLGDFPLVMC